MRAESKHLGVQLHSKAVRNEQYPAEFDLVTDFYGSDLNPFLLDTRLQVFSTARVDKSVGIMDIIKSLKTCRLLNKNSYQKFAFS